MPDRFASRAGVMAIAVALLGAIAAIAYLTIDSKSVPDVLVAVATGALGILAPSPIRQPDPAATGHAVAGELLEAGPMRLHPDDITAVGKAVAKAQTKPATRRQGR